jgi:hypothetical protein
MEVSRYLIEKDQHRVESWTLLIQKFKNCLTVSESPGQVSSYLIEKGQSREFNARSKPKKALTDLNFSEKQ